MPIPPRGRTAASGGEATRNPWYSGIPRGASRSLPTVLDGVDVPPSAFDPDDILLGWMSRDRGGRSDGQAYLRDGGGGQLPGQGAHLGLDRHAPGAPGLAGPAPEVRPVYQRRPGDDEPLPARR